MSNSQVATLMSSVKERAKIIKTNHIPTYLCGLVRECRQPSLLNKKEYQSKRSLFPEESVKSAYWAGLTAQI